MEVPHDQWSGLKRILETAFQKTASSASYSAAAASDEPPLYPFHRICCDTSTPTPTPTPMPVPCFPGTSIPQRVVLTHDRKFEDLLPELQASIRSWNDPALPDLKVLFYDYVSAREFLEDNIVPEVTEAWDALVPAAYKADLFRLCEIFVNGGVYADSKCTRLAPYTSLLGTCGALVIDCLHKGAWNGFFAAPPRAPWIAQAIANALKNIRERAYGANTLDITGPGCCGRAIRKFLGFDATVASCDFLRALAPEPASTLRSTLPVLTVFFWTMRGAAAFDGRVAVSTVNPAYVASKPNTPVGNYTLAWDTRQVFRDAKDTGAQ